jgi:hypothetical protein
VSLTLEAGSGGDVTTHSWCAVFASIAILHIGLNDAVASIAFGVVGAVGMLLALANFKDQKKIEKKFKKDEQRQITLLS